jgi:hypothetical protein
MSLRDIHIRGSELDLCLQSAIIDADQGLSFVVPAASK